MTASVGELVRRIDELESRAVLRDLVSDYCRGFDTKDWDRFVSIWHEDAVWEIGPPFGTFEGHAGIREAVFDVLYPLWRETHHLTSNLKLEFDGWNLPDCVTASSPAGRPASRRAPGRSVSNSDAVTTTTD